MWILQHIYSERSFCLMSGKEYLVGRKDCAIILQNDSSISRKHSIIKLEESSGTLNDLSKYGTYVNGTKVNKEAALRQNDLIHFGQSQNRFRLVKYNLGITTSCINNKETKDLIKTIVKKLGGEMANEWNNKCTHLVMESITFTIKAVCALASTIHIVTPKFIDDLYKACENPSKTEPKPTMYLPEIAEKSLKGLESLFAPNAERKSIFLGKKFIFLSSKQYKRLAPAIRMAGGSVELQEHLTESAKEEYSTEDVLVIAPEYKDEQAATATQKDMISASICYLHGLGLRSIKESEVGLAILHLSLDNYCNPNRSSDDSIAGTTSSQIIHDTVADFTSQWQMTSKTEVKPRLAVAEKPEDILVGDSQANIDKKRKRSAETSMYITDSLAFGVTSALHTPKKPKTRNSDELTSLRKEDKAGWREEGDDNSQQKNRNEEAVGDTSKIKTAEGTCANEEDNDINALANSILEDDDSFGEDLFALDTEKQSIRRSRIVESRASDRGASDKSRVAETQLPLLDAGPTTEGCHDEQSIKVESYNCSRVSDSQPISEDQSDVREDVVEVDGKVEVGRWLGKSDHSGKGFQEKAKELMVPLGYRNSKQNQCGADIKPEIDPDEPKTSAVIQYYDLVMRRKNKTKQPVRYDSNVKNFKKFRKAYFPGKDRAIPRIIGGRDLAPYVNANEERNRIFAEFNAFTLEQRRKAMEVDAMFKMDHDSRHRKRRK